MCPIRSVLRPFVMAAALLPVGGAVADANPRPPFVIYPQVQPYTPGLRIAPNVYAYPQFNSSPSYVYPSYFYPNYAYPYAGPVYNNSFYYGSWGGTSLYPSYPYYGGYFGYSYYRIR